MYLFISSSVINLTLLLKIHTYEIHIFKCRKLIDGVPQININTNRVNMYNDKPRINEFLLWKNAK